MKCDECGAMMSEDDLFCSECGAVLSVPALPTQEEVQESAAPAAPDITRDSRAGAAYALGIVSIGLAAISCIPLVSVVSCMGPIAGLAAIVLGALVKRDSRTLAIQEHDRRRAHQGLVMGIAGIAIYALAAIVGLVLGLGFNVLNEL